MSGEAIENMQIIGQPGPYALSNSDIVLGSGDTVQDYTPVERFNAPTTDRDRLAELKDGSAKLYGTPLTHWSQQYDAIQYGKSQQGFDDAPVTFLCHWLYFKPGLVTVQNDSYVQEKTERK